MAPSMFAFRGADVAAVLRIAEEEVVRVACGAAPLSLSVPTSGDFGRAVPLLLPPGLRNGEAVRLMTGGVAVLDGGLLGRLMAGLSHDEKKSSPGSPAGVESPAELEGAMISVMITSLGYLDGRRISTDANPDISPHLLLRIRSGSSLELVLVLRCRIGGILCFWVFTGEGSRTTMRLEVFRS